MKNVFSLSFIISLRFLGLFIVLPVLSTYALTLEHATTFLVGIVMGGYALTQMIFQIPFGKASDKIGRKKTILFGLVVFIIGSIVCAVSTDIYTLILGRFLQGSGAISGVITAMISDFSKEEQRAKSMAVMGASIGGSFGVAMIVGPLIGGYFGVDKLFIITAILSVFAILMIIFVVGDAPVIKHSYDNKKTTVRSLFKDARLSRMFITFLFHSSIMTMAFLLIPIVMTHDFLWEKVDLWQVYIVAVFVGIFSMPIAVIFGEKKGKGKLIFLISIVFIAISFLVMGFSSNESLFIFGVLLFFVGFNMFEPLLQSFVSKYAKVHEKGVALGTANSFSYLGAFLGGIIGGVVLEYFDREVLAFVVLGISILWFVWILGLKKPQISSNLYLKASDYTQDTLKALDKVESIIEYYINLNEDILVVKYERDKLSEEGIKSYLISK